MFGIQTDTTCGAACWYAREDDCRCSCGGASHGVLLTAGAEQPRRNCTILGHRYVLGTVADRWSEANRIQSEFGKAHLTDPEYRVVIGDWVGPVRQDERRAATWRKAATPAQVAKWPELAEYKGRRTRPELVWVRADVADTFDAWMTAR